MVEVIQVIPREDFTVYVYFDNGHIRLYDMKEAIQKGGVFKKISQAHVFIEKCTVMNGTLAWDISGVFDATKCIDIDPETIYLKGQVITEDPLEKQVS